MAFCKIVDYDRNERCPRSEQHKHYHLRAVPEKHREQVDVRAFGTGERTVFLPYTREVFAETQQWIESRQLFAGASAQAGCDEAAMT